MQFDSFFLRERATMQVGRYQVIDVIGAGANSKVVRAHDPMIGRIVAIKLFSPALAQGTGRDRFLQEPRVVGLVFLSETSGATMDRAKKSEPAFKAS